MDVQELSDRYPDLLAEAVRAILAAQAAEVFSVGATVLADIAWPRHGPYVPPHSEHRVLKDATGAVDGPSSGGPPGTERDASYRAEALRIFSESGWCCHWCGGALISGSVMTTLAGSFPALVPHHKNGRAELTHPMIRYRWPCIDHDEPGSRGGSWTDRANLRAACWPCNAWKGDRSGEQLGWTGAAPSASAWDGLSGTAPELRAHLLQAWEFAAPPIPSLEERPSPRSVRATSSERDAAFNADETTRRASQILDAFATRWGVDVRDRTPKSREFSDGGTALVWLYAPGSKGFGTTEWNLSDAAGPGHLETARTSLARIMGRPFAKYARISCEDLVSRWQQLEPVLEMLLAASRFSRAAESEV